MAHLSEGSKLIRNGSTSQQETGDKFIFNMIKRFNQCAVEMGATNILQPKALSKCGMFSQVYELHRKSNDSVNQIIRRVANCTDYEAYYQSHYYDKWVNIFHPNDK